MKTSRTHDGWIAQYKPGWHVNRKLPGLRASAARLLRKIADRLDTGTTLVVHMDEDSDLRPEALTESLRLGLLHSGELARADLRLEACEAILHRTHPELFDEARKP